jgi:hypothetical protein
MNWLKPSVLWTPDWYSHHYKTYNECQPITKIVINLSAISTVKGLFGINYPMSNKGLDLAPIL